MQLNSSHYMNIVNVNRLLFKAFRVQLDVRVSITSYLNWWPPTKNSNPTFWWTPYSPLRFDSFPQRWVQIGVCIPKEYSEHYTPLMLRHFLFSFRFEWRWSSNLWWRFRVDNPLYCNITSGGVNSSGFAPSLQHLYSFRRFVWWKISSLRLYISSCLSWRLDRAS